jgi:serine/threonine protein kinase
MTPAKQLVGKQLDGGWKVLDYAVRKPTATGSCFSQGYIVEHTDGRKGFLKALDYTAAFASPSAPDVLNAMTKAYVFERDLCKKCSHLSRIARAIDEGYVHTNANSPFHRVDYLIFELAEGDVRAHLDAQAVLDVIFALKTLHHIATGLEQLHRANIAHQDVKPSNVLVYAGGIGSKITDLGRAWDPENPGPHDSYPVAGDPAYAPPELACWANPGAIPPDPKMRRFGCDLYHLGSMVVFLFCRVHMNALLCANLPDPHLPGNWGGSYQEVLPYLQAAFHVALDRFVDQLPDFLRPDLRQIVTQLCEPDPTRRGHPMNRNGNQFALERYVSQFDLLAYRAAYFLKRRR